MEITWLGQAGFLLRDDSDCAVLIDPFFTRLQGRRSPPPMSPEALPPVAVVLVTHEHDDHLDIPFLLELRRLGQQPYVVVPEPIVELAVSAGLDAQRVLPAKPDVPVRAGALTVHAIPAVHGLGGGKEAVSYGFAPRSHPSGGYHFLGYVVELGGVRLYHAGDTLPYDGLAERVRDFGVNVMCLPINGRDPNRESQGIVGNMTPAEAASLAVAVRPNVVIPMHYDGFWNNLGDVGAFAREMESAGASALLVLQPGRAVEVGAR
ncbi:MAG: MBL fold metallo-hydrolase [Firmicutes bacterium]|nr:MBL fold metallo-hydrolase [Bacillota bacterium]